MLKQYAAPKIYDIVLYDMALKKNAVWCMLDAAAIKQGKRI